MWKFPIIHVDNNPITLGNLAVSTLLILVGIRVSRILARIICKRVFSKFATASSNLYTFETLSFYTLVLFLTIFALKIANIPLTIFTVIGGALAIGVGFGSQNIVNNFISGLILMIEQPIKLGDYVEIDGISGTVEHIGIRSTRLLLPDNKQYIVPNSSFLEKNVLNWTLSNDTIRTSVTVGVAYGSPTEKVKELLQKSVEGNEKVLTNPSPVILFADFGDNALTFEMLFWIQVRTLLQRRTIESQVRFRVDQLFRESNITIAFPQRDIHLHTPQPLSVSLAEK